MKKFLVSAFVFVMLAADFINAQTSLAKDIHSFGNPEAVRVSHVELDWNVLFEEKILQGSATLTLDNFSASNILVLDTRDLKIEKTEASRDGKTYVNVPFRLRPPYKTLGSALEIDLPKNAKFVRVFYSTSPQASGLQWLSPAQTAGKKSPFMFSQAQAIHARSFIPLQDSPQIRVTYSARIKTPKGLLAVMSAEGNAQNKARNGVYSFKMPYAIPPYLIAVAVGDIQFRSLGARTGVYSEASVLPKAAFEFADTEKMMEATEKMYGKYAWGRYDLLVLPPSFPFGGMENPRLTFATPTILAGDRSLVSLVAHELAHSWSGNLVTNATWRDFWLNEGFTVYIERRIIEAVYGKNRRLMEATLGKRSLLEELTQLPAPDQILHVDLTGRDPDDGFTGVPYEKGALFLLRLEELVGREKFDEFLRGYFAKHAFKSITTETFEEYLNRNLIDKNPQVFADFNLEEWIEKPGLPEDAPDPQSPNFAEVEKQAELFMKGKPLSVKNASRIWTTQDRLHFLKSMPENLGTEKMSRLDKMFDFTKSGNSEIAFQWLLMAIKNNYAAAYPRLEQFLINIGRRKFVRPLFAELAKTPEGTKRANEIYAKSRAGYHPITQAAIDAILKR